MALKSSYKAKTAPAKLRQKVSSIDHVLAFLHATCMLVLHYAHIVWDNNPARILSRRYRRLYFVENYGEMMIKPRLKARLLDLFLSDNHRRQRLLDWINKQTGRNVHVTNFSTCWQDGTVLCALLESICPGICPSYHLLSGINRVKNCRLGLKLANKYLYVPMDLISAEEIAIATPLTEYKVIQYISMVKWASENIKDKWSTLHESLIAAKTGRCFAKGPGLKSGFVDKRSKFTLLVSDTIGVFNLLVEIRGPNHEYCGERIVSLHQAKALLDKSFDFNAPQSESVKYLEDCTGNTFVRKKLPYRHDANLSHSEPVYIDVTCGDEGTFYVTFIPRRAGVHSISVKWQNHHVENSPFRIKVYKASDVKTLKGARERRVIYDSLSFSSHSADSPPHPDVGHNAHAEPEVATNGRFLSAVSKSKSYSKFGRQLTVTRRRLLRRIITRNGEDIVIEDSISPSLSRQSSINDVSDEEQRVHKNDTEPQRSPDLQQSPVPSSNEKLLPLDAVPEESRTSKDNDQSGTIDVHQTSSRRHIIQYKSSDPLEYSGLDESCYLPSQPEIADGVTTSGQQMVNARRMRYSLTRTESSQASGTYSTPFTSDTDTSEFRSAGDVDTTDYSEAEADGHPQTLPASSNPSHIGPNRTNRRQIFTRSSTIHPYKSVITRSFDAPEHLRRSRLTSRDRSESTAAFSANEPEKKPILSGVLSGGCIRLLHSNSMRKKCLYMSGKAAAPNTLLNDCTSRRTKSDSRTTKLRTALSLPLVTQFWKRDVTSPNSIKGLMNELYSIQSERTEMSHVYARNDDVMVPASHNDTASVSDKCHSTNEHFMDIKNYSPKFKFDFNFSDHLQRKQSPKPFRVDPQVSAEVVPDNDITTRAGLIRQMNIFHSAKSSGDSDTDKTDSNSETGNADWFRKFKNIQRKKKSNSKNIASTGNVITRTATVDQATQVSHGEITSETGWDLIESVYLLIRRISIKVPISPGPNVNKSIVVTSREVPPRKIQEDPEQSKQLLTNSNSAPSIHAHTRNLDIKPIERIDETEYKPYIENRSTENHVYPTMYGDALPCKQNVQLVHAALHDGQVNAWLEQNEGVFRPGARLVRQATRETEDSGFDDNPSNLNRQGRFSLPNILSENGHAKLHRKTYYGARIVLRPSLVESNSSMSADGQAAGHEADDELLPLIDNRNNKVVTRKRHRRRTSEDSFSMSDSELEEKRKRTRRRGYAISFGNGTVDRMVTTSRDDDIKSECRAKLLLSNHPHSKNDANLSRKSLPTVCTPELSTDAHNNVMVKKKDKQDTSEVSTSIRKPESHFTSTSESMDSSYIGFGVTAPNRNDLLSKLDAFQRLCPTEEESGEDPDEHTSKVIHWQDDHQFISYIDTNVISSISETDFSSSDDQLGSNIRPVQDKQEYEQSRCRSTSLPSLVTVPNRLRLQAVSATVDDSSDVKSSGMTSSYDTWLNVDEPVTFLNMFDDDKNVDCDSDCTTENVARIGDVVSMATADGSATMVFRLAGAGLCHGTVGQNNTFQVWVENPSFGPLSVTVTGPRPHSVTETTVLYTGDNLYEVSYGVAEPGSYMICIKWGNCDVTSPYQCEISY